MSDFKRHNFKKLKIWHMAMEIAKNISDITVTFPSYENFGMRSQMDRCSVSTASNVAKGSSRTNKSFSHFLDMSLGSAFELQTHGYWQIIKNIFQTKLLQQLNQK